MRMTFFQPVGLRKVNGKVTVNVLFFLFHLLLQVRQQRLNLIIDSKGGCAAIIAGGLQSQSVKCHEASHRLIFRERAEKNI